MAAEERAKADFSSILTRIERKFEVIDVKWTEKKHFEVRFRTQIEPNSDDYNDLCDEWVDLFSEASNTVWAKKISNTGPKIRFRKQYQCWTQGGKIIQKELLFDARRCKGTLDIKVLTDNPFTRRKNKHIRLGLNVVVKINFNHLHQVDTEKPFSFFVHPCEPLAEAPKPQIVPNDRLSQLVAEIVQKNANPLQKPAASIELPQKEHENSIPEAAQAFQISNSLSSYYENGLLADLEAKNEPNHVELIQDGIEFHPQTMQLLQNVPLSSMEGIKLQLGGPFGQYAQVVVGEMTEPLLMCQSLMFDAGQVIPVTVSSGLPQQFVQIQSQNLQQHNQ